MSVYETRELLPFQHGDLLELVADVANYARFLPWVKASRISNVCETAQGRTFDGEAVIGYKAFRTSFATKVVYAREAGTIVTDLIRGPFRTLRCRWHIWPTTSGSFVDLRLDFEFSEPFLAELLASNMDKAAHKLIEAFTAEAKKRYEMI